MPDAATLEAGPQHRCDAHLPTYLQQGARCLSLRAGRQRPCRTGPQGIRPSCGSVRRLAQGQQARPRPPPPCASLSSLRARRSTSFGSKNHCRCPGRAEVGHLPTSADPNRELASNLSCSTRWARHSGRRQPYTLASEASLGRRRSVSDHGVLNPRAKNPGHDSDLTSRLAAGIKAALLSTSCARSASSQPASWICPASVGGTAPAYSGSWKLGQCGRHAPCISG